MSCTVTRNSWPADPLMLPVRDIIDMNVPESTLPTQAEGRRIPDSMTVTGVRRLNAVLTLVSQPFSEICQRDPAPHAVANGWTAMVGAGGAHRRTRNRCVTTRFGLDHFRGENIASPGHRPDNGPSVIGDGVTHVTNALSDVLVRCHGFRPDGRVDGLPIQQAAGVIDQQSQKFEGPGPQRYLLAGPRQRATRQIQDEAFEPIGFHGPGHDRGFHDFLGEVSSNRSAGVIVARQEQSGREISMRRRKVLFAAGMALAAPRIVRGEPARRLTFVPSGAGLAPLDTTWTPARVTRIHAGPYSTPCTGWMRRADAAPAGTLDGHTTEQDGRLWTLRLRPGLRFHDGSPVLARDALASIRRFCVRDSLGQALMAVVDELTAPDDRTLRFRLARPFPAAAGGARGSSFMLPVVMPERLANTSNT